MDGNGDESDDQKSWKATARALQAELDKLIPSINVMKPGEVRDLVATISDAFWIAVNAETFDRKIQVERDRQHYDLN